MSQGVPEDRAVSAEWEALKQPAPKPPPDMTPVRAEVYRVGRWTYRIRLHTASGWLAGRTEDRLGRRRAERRADELLAEARRPAPGPVYVATPERR